MTTHEFDLDLPADPTASTATALLPGARRQPTGGLDPGPVLDGAGPARPSPRGLLGVTALAMALAGIATGAVLAAAPAGRSDPQPLTATLSSAAITAVDDSAHAVLRLTVENPRTTSAALTALVLDGLEPQRLVVKLAATVAPGQRSTVDVAVRPSCGARTPMAIRLVVTGTPEGFPVLPAGGLERAGGLCGLIGSELPRGFQNSVVAQDSRLEGDDLVLDVPGLAGKDVAGSPPLDHVLQTSAMVADRLVAASVRDGTQLRLPGPAPCFDGSDGDGVPMTARLLVHTSGGLEQELVLAGPQLARWLALDCLK